MQSKYSARSGCERCCWLRFWLSPWTPSHAYKPAGHPVGFVYLKLLMLRNPTSAYKNHISVCHGFIESYTLLLTARIWEASDCAWNSGLDCREREPQNLNHECWPLSQVTNFECRAHRVRNISAMTAKARLSFSMNTALWGLQNRTTSGTPNIHFNPVGGSAHENLRLSTHKFDKGLGQYQIVNSLHTGL